MKKMLFALLTLFVLVLPSGVCADDSSSANTEVEGAVTRRDYVAIVRAWRAFQGANPEMQQALLRIARFASECASMREQDLLDLPGEREVKVHGAGSGVEGVQVQVKLKLPPYFGQLVKLHLAARNGRRGVQNHGKATQAA